MKDEDVSSRIHSNAGDRSQHFSFRQYRPVVHDPILRGIGEFWRRRRLRASAKCGNWAQKQGSRKNDVSISHRPIVRLSSLEAETTFTPV
jgi:hypothetical protein